MSEISVIQSVRTYDFEAIIQSMPVKDVSDIKEYTIPEERIAEVVDQGNIGACAACALAAELSALSVINTGRMEKYSIPYIYGKHRDKYSTSSGMVVEVALESMRKGGSVPYEMFPKLVEMPDIKKMVAERPDLDKFAENSKIAGYCSIRSSNTEDKAINIKLALANFDVPILAVSRDYFGGPHAFLVIGYIEKNGEHYAKILNSWGERYGDKGRGEIKVKHLDFLYLVFPDEIKMPFMDVDEKDWYFKDVRNLYLEGFINGKSDNIFAPEDNMTRAEVCALINRILKRQDEIHQAEFTTLENRLKALEEKK